MLGYESTKEQEIEERKKIAAELIEKVDLLALRMRTLASLSVSNVFPPEYMLKKLQERARRADEPVSGKVTYELTFKSDQIVELEYETGLM